MSSSFSIQTPRREATRLRPVWIHSLAAGTWPGQSGTVTITPEHIQEIADTYSPETHESPAVLGHPKTDDPAYGWVRSLEVREDGLWVNADVVAELAEMIDRQQYKKVSVSLYPPGALANPTPGKFYLKHLGFLGAQAPAVKGLKPVSLSEPDAEQIIIFSQKENRMNEEELAAKQKEIELAEGNLATERAEIEAEKKRIAERQAALRKTELEGMLDTHVNAGRILPRQKPVLLALATSLDGETETISLSEGSPKETLLKHLDGFLAELPAQVDLSERSAPTVVPGVAKPQPASVDLALPDGHEVDPDGLALDKRAMDIMGSNNALTYLEAVKQAKKELSKGAV